MTLTQNVRRTWACYRCGAKCWAPVWVTGRTPRPWCGVCAQHAVTSTGKREPS